MKYKHLFLKHVYKVGVGGKTHHTHPYPHRHRFFRRLYVNQAFFELRNQNLQHLKSVLERRYYAFWKGVIMPFRFSLLRLLDRSYYVFLKGITRLSKRRYYAFPIRIITPFRQALLRLSTSHYYTLLCMKCVIKHFRLSIFVCDRHETFEKKEKKPVQRLVVFRACVQCRGTYISLNDYKIHISDTVIINSHISNTINHRRIHDRHVGYSPFLSGINLKNNGPVKLYL